MEKRNIYLYLLLLVVHSSCVNVDVVEIEAAEPKLVLNASLSPQQEIEVHLSKSIGFGSSQWDAELKKPAVIRVYIDEEFRGNMINDDKKEVAVEEEGYQKIKGSYRLPGVIPCSGNEIKIEAEVEGYPAVVASTRIPDAPVLLSVDTVRYANVWDQEMMRLYVRLKDDQAQRNFYRMFLSSEIAENDVKGDEWFAFESGPYYYYGYIGGFWMVDYEDPAFKADFPTHAIGSDQVNSYGIFTDNLFNGKEYVLKLSFTDPMSSVKSDSVDLQVRYNVRLLSISESYYNYYKRNSNLSLSVADIQLTPTGNNYTSFSNVENGLGLVFSYNEAKREIDMQYKSIENSIENRED